jgi:hypothetical protein
MMQATTSAAAAFAFIDAEDGDPPPGKAEAGRLDLEVSLPPGR